MAQSIAQQVKESGQLSNYRLGVGFKDGVATLAGTVANQAQAQAAVEIASGLTGVEKVVNRLEIQGAPEEVAPQREESNGLLMSLDTAPKPQPKAAIQPQALSRPNTMPQAAMARRPMRPNGNLPLPMAAVNRAAYNQNVQQAQCAGCQSGGYPGASGGYAAGGAYGGGGGGHNSANLPGYAWPSYAAHPNYSALTYPKQYSPTAWPYIGPFYPYPQVPLGWRKVSLEWDDGWWFLDFSHHQCQ